MQWDSGEIYMSYVIYMCKLNVLMKWMVATQLHTHTSAAHPDTVNICMPFKHEYNTIFT